MVDWKSAWWIRGLPGGLKISNGEAKDLQGRRGLCMAIQESAWINWNVYRRLEICMKSSQFE